MLCAPILALPSAAEGQVPEVASVPLGLSAQETDPPVTLRIGARLQVRHTQASAAGGEWTGSTRIRRGRLSASGEAYQRLDYLVQLELSGAQAHLIDAAVRYTISPEAVLWFGQGKAPFGRQQLNSSRDLHFVDRTLVDSRFSAGRQQGVALTGRLGGTRLEYGAGIYDGNGINQPDNPNDRFMTVARVVLTPLGAYGPVEGAHDRPASPRIAVGGSGFRNTVGEGSQETRLTRINGEGAFKFEGLNMVGEFYREWTSPAIGSRTASNGWYYQAGYLLPEGRHEIAGRYGEIRPPAPSPGGQVETGVAYSYYIDQHRAKVQADLRNIRSRATDTDHRELRIQFQLTM